MTRREELLVLAALVLLFLAGCSFAEEDSARQSICTRLADGRAYKAITVLWPGTNDIAAWEYTDENGFRLTIEPENSAQWRCRSTKPVALRALAKRQPQ